MGVSACPLFQYVTGRGLQHSSKYPDQTSDIYDHIVAGATTIDHEAYGGAFEKGQFPPWAQVPENSNSNFPPE